MMTLIVNIGIFIVISQLFMYFCPGEQYEKYIKVIVGLMIIIMLVSGIRSFI